MRKKSKPTYLALYQNGIIDTSAQIHYWHDDKHLTVEYLPYLDMMVWVSLGQAPAFEPINVEATHDIDLDNLPNGYDGYKLHYTWLTIAGDFARNEKEATR